MEQSPAPIAFKVRTQGKHNGKKGGVIKSGGGGAGALWYFDKTFTVATHQDQWVCVPTLTTSDTTYKTTFPTMPATHTDKPFRYLSVCSGMEAASVAWHPLGWEPAGFSEIEPFPAAILAHRFPNTPNHGDLTQHHTWPIEPNSIDLLVGGTPCQSFSVAGLRKGLADPRGNLALTFLGLADRLKPRWIVWENVPGVLSSGGGRDFGSFLGALVELGYSCAYRVLDAQYFGVPQRRRRVFVVACFGDWRAPAEVLSLREGLRGYLETGGKKRKSPAADAGGGAEASGLQRTVGTLCDDTHPGAYSGQDAYTGRLIPSHWEGGDVHPTLNQSAKGSGGVGSSNQELFSQGGAYLVPGEPIPYRKAKRAQSTTDDETWVEGQVSNTLNNFDLGDTRTTHAVVEPIISPAITTCKGSRGGCSDEAIQEITAVHLAHQQAIPIHDQATRHAGKHGDKQDGKGNGLGIGLPGDPMNTLTQGDKHAVAYHQMPGTHIAYPMAVRRLTPVECERLQGFPDNWSRISWKGKPETDCPDGPRYKACGNSMAVPVMRWIGEQIKAYESNRQ